MFCVFKAPWINIIAESIQVDAAAAMDTSGTAPLLMSQNGVSDPAGGRHGMLFPNHKT